ncbi:hypothetical protein BC628DRAFT_1321592 [Trametes gibbosa]|nr:hypothetical protein BC628DRAFT_1321592 [Trametes gibbosa]
MTHVHFSWSDSFQAAFSSCLPCIKHPDAPSDSEDYGNGNGEHPRRALIAHGIIPPPRARPDELEGLLADASDDAETLSLHSNIGNDRRRGKGKGKSKSKKWRNGAPKHIRVFGYDLFGRPPAIHLPETDDEAEPPRGGEDTRTRTISTDTLDSDAAPLDVAAIEGLSAARHAEALEREAEERRAKAERRRRRRERRELKRAAMTRALEQQTNGGEEFEGFQGSGPAYDLGGPLSPSLGSGSGSMSVSDSQDFGPFAQGQFAQPFDTDAALAAEAEAEGDGADFGAESYTRRPRRSTLTGGRSGTSDTRSSSTGTGSNSQTYPHPHPSASVAPYNHQYLAQQQQHPMPRSPLSPVAPGSDSVPPSPGVAAHASASDVGNGMKKHRRKSTRPKAQSISVSVSGSSASATASQTASLVSPVPSEAPVVPRVYTPQQLSFAAPMAQDDFEGFPGDFGVQELQMGSGTHTFEAVAPQKGAAPVSAVPEATFPSVGLRGIQRTKSDMGVFLARRGDE